MILILLRAISHDTDSVFADVMVVTTFLPNMTAVLKFLVISSTAL